MSGFAELIAATNFSFLRGASHPEEMVAAAAALGLSAIGICDRNGFPGVVRAHLAAKEAGIKLLVGTRLVTRDGFEIAAYPTCRAAYGRLSRMLTNANFRAKKGECDLGLEDIAAASEGQIFILIPPIHIDDDWTTKAQHAAARLGADVYLALLRRFDGKDGARLFQLAALADRLGIDAVAATDALYHVADRRPLQDVITCIREHVTIKQAGYRLQANAERHLKAPAEVVRIFTGYEDAVARSLKIAGRIGFSLDELVYNYPDEVIGENETPMQTLRRLTAEGMERRYPDGAPEAVRAAVRHELGLIEQLDYASYFLTVYDIVRFARSQGILCQGRGSAANSAVCFCIGVTEVDPARIDLLFERFISAERGEPPDIDVDFEHERREEVIQYVYEKYGRRRAAMTATVACYRSRGAIREVGKVFGLTGDVIAILSKLAWGWGRDEVTSDRIRSESGLDPDEPGLAMALVLARELMGFPRHLSQHPGGFVMTLERLDDIVPIHNAAMPERTAIEWDKEDIDALGVMKVDVLGLGMLSCVRKAFDLVKDHYGRSLTLASIPEGDERVYDMICVADTVGVFQIESRAQMTMLPRLRPRNFYDLVIEVAIVRPGPIQGDMVHPYLRRRDGREQVEYPSQALRAVLGKTLGVPLFQEQAMKVAIVAGGFTPAEADQLRRSMAAFRRSGTIAEMGTKLVSGMIANGYEKDFAERCFKQLEGFGEYGFPESHAASFALIVYVSAWLKYWYPDVFLAALLNSQPMGFYAPAQLVRDAISHGVEVRPPDVNASHWDSTLEETDNGAGLNDVGGGRQAVRIGLRQIKGLRDVAAARLMAARDVGGAFASVDDVARRAGLARREMALLAEADAFRSLAMDRRQAGWRAMASQAEDLPLFAARVGPAGPSEPIPLPEMTLPEHVTRDYGALHLSLKAHPMAILRPVFNERGYRQAESLRRIGNNRSVAIAGLVVVRQRPGTASGVIFATLEDETGIANVVIWPKVFERNRRTVIGSKLLGVIGKVQSEGKVIHVIADQLIDHSHHLAAMSETKVFAGAVAPSDEVNRAAGDPRIALRAREQDRMRRLQTVMPKSRDFH